MTADLPATPALCPLPLGDDARAGFALTVDVEEWYHTCLVPEFVDPERRPVLTEELDWLLPELLELLAATGSKATFFVLGEVAARLPERVREITGAGHEIACHGYLHLRADDRSTGEFAADARQGKEVLEAVTGCRVEGFRAPEWSLRTPANPRLRGLAEAGFRYDSSLAPVVGAGRWSNPRAPYRLRWQDGLELIELPPLTFGGLLQLPAGSWPGRLAPTGWIAAAARRQAKKGWAPVMVFHPWEVSGRPTPGALRGFARFIHETGRAGYRAKLSRLLRALPWGRVDQLLSEAPNPAVASERGSARSKARPAADLA